MTEPTTEPSPVPATGPGGEATPGPPVAGSRRHAARALRRLPSWLWAGLVVAVLVVGLLVVALANGGHRVGPVDPADPPVGGTVLPATRLT